jgi:hypothetical protein
VDFEPHRSVALRQDELDGGPGVENGVRDEFAGEQLHVLEDLGRSPPPEGALNETPRRRRAGGEGVEGDSLLVIHSNTGTARPSRFRRAFAPVVGAEGDPLVLRVAGQRWDGEQQGSQAGLGVSQLKA